MLIQTTTCLITREQFPLKNLSSVVGSPQRRGSRRTTKQSVSNSHCSAAPVFASPFTCLWLIAAGWIAELPSFSPSVLPCQGSCLHELFWSRGDTDRPLVSCRRKECISSCLPHRLLSVFSLTKACVNPPDPIGVILQEPQISPSGPARDGRYHWYPGSPSLHMSHTKSLKGPWWGLGECDVMSILSQSELGSRNVNFHQYLGRRAQKLRWIDSKTDDLASSL